MDLFNITGGKRTYDEYPVSVDFTKWLNGETISSVAYSAVRLDTGADATADVLDSGKHTNTTTAARPWIKAGTVGISYEVRVRVTSSAGAKKEAKIRFTVS